jgi:hypothetical protein
LTDARRRNIHPREPLPGDSRLQEEIKFCRVCALVVNTRSRQGETLYHRAKALLQRGFSLAADDAINDPSRLLERVANVIAEGP